MRIVVTGAAGLLGQAVTAAARGRGHPVVPLDSRALDVTDPDRCRHVLGTHRPDWIVHCAAYTAVDKAEREACQALEVNRDGTRNVVSVADSVGARVLFPSTDYVFDGNARQPYRPDHSPAPLGVYGRSKLAGEAAVRASAGAHLIVRTSWLYGAGGGNFVDTIRRLARERDELEVVGDQTGRPTWVTSLAEGMFDLIHAGAAGTFHLTDEGTATWVELARAVIEIDGLEACIVPVTTEAWGADAPRPSYSVLDLDATTSLLGRPRPHWRSSLEAYLRERA
jgi:dTDP-4-dehydrorhamnose reductase